MFRIYVQIIEEIASVDHWVLQSDFCEKYNELECCSQKSFNVWVINNVGWTGILHVHGEILQVFPTFWKFILVKLISLNFTNGKKSQV